MKIGTVQAPGGPVVSTASARPLVPPCNVPFPQDPTANFYIQASRPFSRKKKWALVQGQRLLPCLPEAVTNLYRSSIKRTNDSVR